jgi:hypothetical protein
MVLPNALGWLGEALCTPPIAVIAFNRPHYLKQFLASLAAQQPRINPRRVHLVQDGAVNRYSGIRYAADADIAASISVFRNHFPIGHVHSSPQNLGIAENVLRAEKLLFETLGAPVGYFFEDDLVLSPHYVAALDRMRRALARFDRIVYFNANGSHRSSLEEQRRNAGKLVFMGNFTAFALKRSHWIRMKPFLDGYHRLVIGTDERIAPRDQLRALLRSWGRSQTHPHTGQDGARDLATHLMSRWRATCFQVYSRSIGLWGTHVRPEIFEELGLHQAVIYPEPLGPLKLSRPEVDREIDRNMEGNTRIFSQVYADQIAALSRA